MSLSVERAAVIGGGVIGAGWAARFVLNGIDVALHDPDPDIARKVGEVMANAERAWARLTMAPPARRGRLTFAPSIAAAVEGAGLVQESAPEREALKIRLLGEIDAHAGPAVPVCSSTSGLLPSRLQAGLRAPGRFLVGHPFNPVYLLPLVELCGGAQTDPAMIEAVAAFYRLIGMQPLVVRKEIDGFIADRLLEALWREALWLVHDEIATVAEIDDAIRYGAGLRWAQMGTFLTYRIAGGEAGMRHFLAQFGPSLRWPWTKLMDTPELTDQLIDRLVAQSDAQAGGRSIRELEQIRDDNLIAILQALKTRRWGAGAVQAAHEARLFDAAHAAGAGAAPDLARPLRLHEAIVQPDWVDYNNHMTESRYLQVFGDASDAFLRLIGADAAYNASGFSYYTVETHLRHLREVAGLEPLACATQLLDADEKRLHLFHELRHGRDDRLLATGEHMLLHVDTRASAAVPAAAPVRAKLEEIRAAQAALPRPEAAGWRIAMTRER